MTALPARRRRTTLIASVAAATAVALVIALTIVGALALYNSTDGADASGPRDELVFPQTPIGAIAALDATGRLASVAVLVVQPAGSGGSIVTVPVSADSSGGAGTERLPLDETYAVQGEDALRNELGVVLRLGLDDIAFVDANQLADLLAPIGPLQVDLPVDVTDAGGKVVAEAGATQMDATAAAAVLTSRDPSVPAVQQYPAAAAVWSAVAQAIGTGVTPGSAPSTTAAAASSASSAPTTSDPGQAAVDGLFAKLIAGRVGVRALRTTPVAADQNPRGVDVCLLDPAEVILVFGQIAPVAVSAPGSGLSFRIVSAFSDAQLAGTGLTNTDAAYRAITTILAVGGNVVSVATTGEAPGAATALAVSDAEIVDGAKQVQDSLGAVKVTVAEQPIAGVDVVATLGTDFLKVAVKGGGTTTTTGPTTEPGSVPATTTEATDG